MHFERVETRPVKKQYEIDEIRIVTYFGSQSTDYAVKLFSNGKLVHEEDVRSIEDGIHFLHDML